MFGNSSFKFAVFLLFFVLFFFIVFFLKNHAYTGTHVLPFCIVDTMSSSINQATTAGFHLAALNVNYDIVKDGTLGFPQFVTKLEQKFMSPGTSLRDRLDLVNRTVCIYTWKKLENVYEQLERSWSMNARRPNHFVDPQRVRHFHRMAQPSPHNFPQPSFAPSPQDPALFNRDFGDDVDPQVRWLEVREAFINRLMRDSNIDTRQMLAEFTPLTDISLLDIHTHKFNEALSVHNSLGHTMSPREATSFYLQTIPNDFVWRMQELPRSVHAAHAEVLRMSTLQNALRKCTNTPGPAPVNSFQRYPNTPSPAPVNWFQGYPNAPSPALVNSFQG